MANIKLGSKLKEIRKRRKLTQQQIADLTAVSLKTIQRYEKGENVSEYFINTFSEVLKLSYSERHNLSILSYTDAIYNMYDGIKQHEKEVDEIITTINKLINLLGYEIDYKTLSSEKESEYYEDGEVYLLRNTITNETYILPDDDFVTNNASLILNFVQMLIDRELEDLKPISNNEFDYLETDEYFNILKDYYTNRVQIMIQENKSNKKDKIQDFYLNLKDTFPKLTLKQTERIFNNIHESKFKINEVIKEDRIKILKEKLSKD